MKLKISRIIATLIATQVTLANADISIDTQSLVASLSDLTGQESLINDVALPLNVNLTLTTQLADASTLIEAPQAVLSEVATTLPIDDVLGGLNGGSIPALPLGDVGALVEAPQAVITEVLGALPAGDVLGGLNDGGIPTLPLGDVGALVEAPQAVITEVLGTLPTGDVLGGLNGGTPTLPTELPVLSDVLAPLASITGV